MTVVAPPRTRPGFAPNEVGVTTVRPDGVPKVKGEFEYSSDMHVEGMLWGATLRSPHPSATIAGIDIAPALALPGVRAVLTHEDVPGRKLYGMEVPDQPVLAFDRVRFQGEPVAIVAADHPETARRAAAAIEVHYDVHEPLIDAEAAMAPEAEQLHEAGNVLRHIAIRHGEPETPERRASGPPASAEGPVSGDHTAPDEITVTAVYEIGMQDQAFLGPESGLAAPDGEGGVDLYIATQWLHVDQDQLAASLGLPPEKVRLTLAGVGGAFGGREDLSMQIHACMLALHTDRPVKMVYDREESFFGHVHRHPCRLEYEHRATRDGKLVHVRARVVLDGGAYASSSRAVCANAACFACGPYAVPSATIDAYVVYTNNPPCGAMRGFGAVQTCFAYESQMDKLAAALGMDPVQLRIVNAMAPGDRMPTGQVVREPAPVAELLERVRAMPMPTGDGELPGGVSNATRGEGVRRGVGYGVGFKNVGFSEGFDDPSTARVRLSIGDDGEPLAEVHTAAAEVGQGIVIVQAQIARTELGVGRVAVLDADTRIGSAGSTSASRQTYVTGGAVKAACEAVRERVLRAAADRLGRDPGELALVGGEIVERPAGGAAGGDPGEREASAAGGDHPGDDAIPLLPLADLLADDAIEETIEWRHRPTFPLDERGQGDAHVQYAFSAHRAVVDVDVELGVVRVVELATAQEVGKAINPQAVEGQIEGGSAQGLGLALLEEVQMRDGKVLNASFTDYLLPTILDMPPMRIEVLENADPEAPYGLTGVGEPPNISTPPAVVAALRDATGRPLPRMPVRPEHIVGLEGSACSLDEDAFVARFGAVAEGSPWVAREVWRRRPFADLHAAFVQAIRTAPPERRLALIRAHPELAGRTASDLTPASASEQASAGLHRLAPADAAALQAATSAYRARFDFPFVVCVREHTVASIIATARERLQHDRAHEIDAALTEIGKIIALRLKP